MEDLKKLHAIWQTGSDDAAADASNDIMEALPELLERVKRLEAIEIAARTYFVLYCQDEAADDGPEVTGCGQSQHESAKMLRAALLRGG